MYFEIDSTYDDKGKRKPVLGKFYRCPTATVSDDTWLALNAARQYLAGLFPPTFRPSAQFAEAVIMVKTAQGIA